MSNNQREQPQLMAQIVALPNGTFQAVLPPDASPHFKACICSDAIRALAAEQARWLMQMDGGGGQQVKPRIYVAGPGFKL
jgi:hypothetical protein